MAGMNRFEGKERRRQRMKNHTDKDPKYRNPRQPREEARTEDEDYEVYQRNF